MQTTATTTAGSHTDLLTGILNVQVRNEDKITEQDRQYCQLQQDQLYKTLDRIDRWYAIFKEEAEQYRGIKNFRYEDNGKVTIRNFHFNYSGEDDYTHNEFKPFDLINELADNNYNANANFANRIVSYFNRKYNVNVPVPQIDGRTLRMDFRPVYQTYMIRSSNTSEAKVFGRPPRKSSWPVFRKTVQPARRGGNTRCGSGKLILTNRNCYLEKQDVSKGEPDSNMLKDSPFFFYCSKSNRYSTFLLRSIIISVLQETASIYITAQYSSFTVTTQLYCII